MNTATLVIAVLGLALSAASITWQAATFTLSGARVKVRLNQGLYNPSTGGAMVAAPSIYTPRGREAIERMGYTEHVLLVEATNTGRMATSIEGWKVAFGNGAAYNNPTDPRNPQLPHRLESHSKAAWTMEAHYVQAIAETFAAHGSDARTIRGQVEVGNGKTVRSRNALVVEGDAFAQLTRRALISARARGLLRSLPGFGG